MIFGWHFLAIAMYTTDCHTTQYRYREEKTMKKSDVIKVLEAIRDNDYNQALEDKKRGDRDNARIYARMGFATERAIWLLTNNDYAKLKANEYMIEL